MVWCRPAVGIPSPHPLPGRVVAAVLYLFEFQRLITEPRLVGEAILAHMSLHARLPSPRVNSFSRKRACQRSVLVRASFAMHPDKLYKYCTAKTGIRIVRDARIRFTPPEEFNDPFDQLPSVGLDEHDLDRMAKQEAQIRYAFDGTGQGGVAPSLSYNEFMARELPKLREHARQGAAKLPPSFPDDLRKQTGKIFGVFCLTTSKDNLTMWAHYADEHQGCVIEFDAGHKFFVDQSSLQAVKYSQERLRYKHGDKGGGYLYQKSSDWEKEQEWRMHGEFSQMENEPWEDEKTKTKKTIYLAKIPPETITAVFLGLRMQPESIKALKQLCQAERKHVRLYRTELHPKEFALSFSSLVPQQAS